MDRHFLRNSSPLMPPPYFAASRHQSDTAHHQLLPSSSANPNPNPNANANFLVDDVTRMNSRYTDPLLESEFTRLSFMTPAARPPAYGGSIRGSTARSYSGSTSFPPPPQLRDLDIRRMRIQSAARQIGTYQPQINYNSQDFAGNLIGSSAFDALNPYNPDRNFNLNGYLPNQSFRNSCYDYNPGRNLNLNGYSPNQSFRNSCYDFERSRRNSNNFGAMLAADRVSISAATDQLVCRYLQSKFKEGKPEEIEMIFMEVKDHLCELMVDRFGNCLLQKFLALCNQEQITQLLFTLISDEHRFMDICVDAHGSRSVQKVLEHLTTPEQRCRVIQVLKHITLPLAKTMNGHHVLQYILKNYSVQEKTQILNVVADNCMEIATDKSGCCVLQYCVEHAVGEARDRLISEITSNSLMLSEHPYGNYVVQYILSLKMPPATAAIVSQLTGNIVSLSMSKYGSNVVEKFLKDPEINQEAIIQELVYSSQFLRVLQDPFGNYVAQSAFAASEGVVRNAMISFVQANVLNLHSHPHGKSVLQCIKGNKSRV